MRRQIHIADIQPQEGFQYCKYKDHEVKHRKMNLKKLTAISVSVLMKKLPSGKTTSLSTARSKCSDPKPKLIQQPYAKTMVLLHLKIYTYHIFVPLGPT